MNKSEYVLVFVTGVVGVEIDLVGLAAIATTVPTAVTTAVASTVASGAISTTEAAVLRQILLLLPVGLHRLLLHKRVHVLGEADFGVGVSRRAVLGQQAEGARAVWVQVLAWALGWLSLVGVWSDAAWVRQCVLPREQIWVMALSLLALVVRGDGLEDGAAPSVVARNLP